MGGGTKVSLPGGALYRMVFERSRDSIIVLQLKQGAAPVILDANPAALAMHGYSRRQLVGRPASVLGASLSRGRLQPGDTSVFEVKQRRRDGSPLVAEVTARNFRSGGELYGILIERDVTWRRAFEEEARALSARIMLAREEEKKRLAAGLHDAVGAMQVGLSAELLLLEDHVRRGAKAEALSSSARARSLLKELSSGIKRSCVESWPPALPVSGLSGALDELLSAFSRRSGIGVRRTSRLSGAKRLSASPAAIIIYRLAQEALNNAEKHSGADTLHFSLSGDGKWLTLEVRDDGRGFAQGPTRSGKARAGCLGLKIMADAASAAGGSFSVYSRPGGGTRVRADIPVTAGAAAL
ncbi:MAG: PAS/PAC sensor signal transduction histidine kinase [Elusimicrobia bacterium]|nr:MAG: PAS/PAC sensor signal transduction histidine kinase [Elusimicrobiota bacterium]KAF0153686.1 MAG: PAS/PAC sensor signal transduction histidine kinase [Elusimicrobiota bacterium]